MTKYIRFWIASILFCICLPAISQINQTDRVEFNDEFEDYELFTFGNNGSVVTSSIDGENQTTIRRFELVDKNLNRKNKINLSLERKSKSYFYSSTKELFFLNRNKKEGSFELYTLKVPSLDRKKVSGIFPKKANIEEWLVLNDKAYFALSVKKKHLIQVVDLKSGSSKSYFPDTQLGEKKLSFYDLEPVSEKKDTELFFVYKSGKKQKLHYSIMRFDEHGKSIGKLVVHNYDETHQLQSLTFSKDSKNNYLMSGTYSTKNTKKPVSEGIFFAKLNHAGSKQFITYTNYLDLKNFTSYLSERRQEKIEKKKNKKEKKGKELTLNYLCAIHDITESPMGYTFVGEFYYPTYRTETYTTTDANGNTITRTRQVFDGYQYTHAAIASFSQNGKMLWSNTFEMWPSYKPFYVKRFLTVTAHESGATDLIFCASSTIKSMAFDKNGRVKNEHSLDILTTFNEADKVRWTSSNDVLHLYDQYFLASGTQKIKNKEEKKKGNKKKRVVFFINKVAFK